MAKSVTTDQRQGQISSRGAALHLDCAGSASMSARTTRPLSLAGLIISMGWRSYLQKLQTDPLLTKVTASVALFTSGMDKHVNVSLFHFAHVGVVVSFLTHLYWRLAFGVCSKIG